MTTFQKKLTFSLLAALSVVFVAVAPVAASEDEYETKEVVKEECTTGQYGDRVCKKVVERERVKGEKHEVTEIEAGIEDIPFGVLAGVFGVMATGFFMMSRATKSVYWLE